MIEIIGDCSAAESAVADQGGRDTGEGQEMLSFALVAAVQAATPGQPRHRPLHGPPVAAQLLGGLDASAGEARGDVARAEPFPQAVVGVALVAMELGGPPSAGPAPGADGRYAPYQGFKSLTVVHVRGGDTDRDGQTGPLGDQVDL